MERFDISSPKAELNVYKGRLFWGKENQEFRKDV